MIPANELETLRAWLRFIATRYGLAVIFVVVDNGMYGTIRMHQERQYPARVSGTDLVNPDFAALARAYGAHGETVLRTEEFAPEFERAAVAVRRALLHLVGYGGVRHD